MPTRTALLIVLLIVSCHSANAQADFLFPYDSAAVFQYETEYRTAYIDSSVVDDDGTHYFFKGNFEGWTYEGSCWDATCDATNSADTWFGLQYSALNNFHHRFFTTEDETLEFDFGIAVGDSMEFFVSEHEYYIKRLADAVTDEWVSEETDYVYEIKVYDEETSVDSPFDGYQIKLGAVTGLHSFFDVSVFPQELRELHKAGNTVLHVGVEPLTYEEVFDFEVGDVFQYRHSSHPEGSSSTSYKTYTVLSKTEEGGQIHYEYLLEQFTIVYQIDYENFDPPLYEYPNPYETGSLHSEGQIAPNFYGPRYQREGTSTNTLTWSEGYGIEGIKLSVYSGWEWEMCSEEYDDCFFQSFSLPSYTSKQFVPGLGAVYSNYTDGSYGWSTELIYYNKQGDEWGELALSIGDNAAIEVLQNAYPNPSSDIVNLTHPIKNGQLYTSTGKFVRWVNGSQFDIQHLSAGRYILVFEDASGQEVSINLQKVD